MVRRGMRLAFGFPTGAASCNNHPSMPHQPSREQRSKAEAFGRQHLTELVTLLFTDIVGSTALKQQLGDQAATALIDSHRQLVRDVLGQFPEGEVISTTGDSFLILFAKPSDGIRFALIQQSRLRSINQSRKTAVEDRIGLHLGEVSVVEDGDAHLHGVGVVGWQTGLYTLGHLLTWGGLTPSPGG